MLEFIVDLEELSAVSVLGFGPFGCTFLHKGGGATADNCKIRGSQTNFTDIPSKQYKVE